MNFPEREDAEPYADADKIPESQLWMTREPHKSWIKQGLEWLESTEPSETDLESLLAQVSRKT